MLRQRDIKADCYAVVIDEERCYPELINQVRPKPILPWRKKPILGSTGKPLFRSISHLAAVAFYRFNPARLAEYDLLQAHYQPSPWLCYFAHRRYGIPYTYYAQGVFRELYPRPFDAITVPERRAMRFVLKNFRNLTNLDYEAVTNASLLIANSRHVAGQMAHIYGVNKVEVLYPGVDVGLFRPIASTEASIVASKYGIPLPFIIMTSQHVGYKRIDWLIEIMQQILKEVPLLSVVIVGRHNSYCTPGLMGLAEKLGIMNRVIFLDGVEDRELPALYSLADAYVFTPPDEDFGMAPVEAMCCGTPVVAWNAAGPRETVVDGKYGFLAKAYDFQDFASKVVRLATDKELNRKLSVNALEVRKKFSLEAHALSLIRMISSIVGNPQPREPLS